MIMRDFIKVTGFRMLDQVKDMNNFQMGVIMKETIKMVSLMVLASIFGKMVKFIKGNGKMD